MLTVRTKLPFLLIAALLLATGCPAELEDTGGEVALTTQPYLIGPWTASSNMYAYVADHALKVCLTRNPGTTMSVATLQTHVRNAVSKWVAAVQPVATVTLFSTVSFGCPRIDNVPLWDFEVVLSPGTDRAHTWDDGMELFEGEGANFSRVTVHEWGHAFQLDDTYIEGSPGCKPNQPATSVMCNPRSFTALQTDDIRGARQSYREAHPSQYSGPRPIEARSSGRCVDVIGFGTANGTKTQLWDCTFGPTTNQVWAYNSTTRALVGEGSGKCLEIDSWNTANGAKVQVWDCHGGANQKWEFWADGTIRSGLNGKCLEVASFGTANGSAIQMWDCHGGSNQTWWWF